MLMTLETARAVERAETNTLLARLSAIRKVDGNREGVFMQTFGEATAFVIKGIPDLGFNSVRGLNGLHTNELDGIIAFYREHQVAFRLDVAPFDLSAELLRGLAERGFYQYGFHASLCGSLEGAGTSDGGAEQIAVRKLEEHEFELYGEIYTASFGMPAFLAPAVGANNRILLRQPGWSFYVASCDHAPAAIAALHVQDGIANLAAAATLPAFRRRGCQAALLHARIREARRHGCRLIVGQAGFGSGSHMNMERAGLRVAYTKALWKATAK